MSGQLRATLQDHADQLDRWDVDLEAVVRSGDRRIRRRRAALAGGCAAVLVLVVGVTMALRPPTTPEPAPAVEPTKPFSYAVGSVIHSGSDTVDVGVHVESMVQIDGGFVFTGPDRTVYLEKNGDTQAIGHLADRSSPLFASDNGLVAAWWDGERIQTWPGYRPTQSGAVVAEDKTDSFEVAGTWPRDNPPKIEALSDGHLWFWDGTQTMVAEVRPLTSTATWRVSDVAGPDTIQDVSARAALVRAGHEGPGHETVGMAVIATDLRDLAGKTWPRGVGPSTAQPQVRNISSGDLAPDGEHWFTQDNDQFAVFDSATGQRQDPAHPGFAFAAPYQWLGNDTMAVLALKGMSDHESISLLTCHVSTNDCEVTASDIGYYGDVAIPAGEAIGG
jgi:hypothetical protein